MSLFNKKIEEKKEKAVKGTAKVKVAKEVEKKTMKDLYEDETLKTGKKAESGEKGTTGSKKIGQAYRILLKPQVTEKAANLGALNKYVFSVSTEANKIEIAKAIEEVYGIKPESVNIVKGKGKVVRRGRTVGRRKNWKKAIVSLPAGKTIKVYEGV